MQYDHVYIAFKFHTQVVYTCIQCPAKRMHNVNNDLSPVCTFTVDVLAKDNRQAITAVYCVVCQFTCLYILTQTYSHFNLQCS